VHRRSVNKRKSAKKFVSSARKTHVKNAGLHPQRCGYRL